MVCTGPLRYIGQEALQTDIDNFKAALQGVEDREPFLPAVAPGTVEHWMENAYYPSDEMFLNAIADAMHEEYKAIAGRTLPDPTVLDWLELHLPAGERLTDPPQRPAGLKLAGAGLSSR